MPVLEMMHRFVWGPWTLLLFLGTGIWLSVRLEWFQLTGFRIWWKETAGSFGVEKGSSGTSAFRGACTALAATIGTGNIVGVATALLAGGPGAVFWMWVSAAIGMATAYAETYLGQKYKYRKADGHWLCGPMIYMERGLGSAAAGAIYAALVLLASFSMGSMVQAGTVGNTFRYHFPLPGWLCGIILAAGTAAVIRGGVERISRLSGILVPVSAGLYLLFSMIVIFSCADCIPRVLVLIIREAFCLRAAGGGFVGFFLSAGMRYGLSRGVFSNEAGLGTMAVLQGAAEDTQPEEQGMWAMFAVYFDTIVICTMTALVLLCVSLQYPARGRMNGAAWTAWCFSRRLGSLGTCLVSASMIVFAFATIMAWFYAGMQMAEYLDRRWGRSFFSAAYPYLYLFSVFLGCIGQPEAVWLIADLVNGLMAFPNLLTLILLSGQVHAPQNGTRKNRAPKVSERTCGTENR